MIAEDTKYIEEEQLAISEVTDEEIDALIVETTPLAATYLRELKNYRLLDKEEELALFKRYKEDGDKDAFQTIYLSNLRLVVSIAKKYRNGRKSMEFMDLIQEGNLGLFTAIDHFDHTLGNRFSTYATWWIKQKIMRGISNSDDIIRVPVHLQDKCLKANKLILEETTKLGRELSADERNRIITAVLSDTTARDAVYEYNNIESAKGLISLNTPVYSEEGESETCLEDYVPLNDPDEGYADVLARDLKDDILNSMAECLTEKELYVLEHRFGFSEIAPETLEVLSKRLGVTKERIRQIESMAIKKLRRSAKIKHLKDYLV